MKNMSSLQVLNILRKLPIHHSLGLITSRNLNYAAKEYSNPDPGPTFIKEQTQKVLKLLTRIDLKRVYRKHKLGSKKLEQPVYKFMTDEELQASLKAAQDKAEQHIQMPPVVAVRQPVDNIISKDPALQGLETSKFVFTDITYGVRNTERIIVVRETDGTLREASWNIKDRMNQIYFPTVCRKLRVPLMFQDDHYLESLLNRKQYEFILDRACVQFEPNDEDYQRVTSITYQFIDKNHDFDMLRSTRHFGPLTFFLVWFKSIDNLLLDLITTSHGNEAACLIKFYCDIHKLAKPDGQDLNVVEEYIEKYSAKKGQLELVLQGYKEAEEQRKMLEQGLKTAHGLS